MNGTFLPEATLLPRPGTDYFYYTIEGAVTQVNGAAQCDITKGVFHARTPYYNRFRPGRAYRSYLRRTGESQAIAF